ncbi:hypothetical protein HK097_003743, partial [Rhizophlyctis rosea]
MAEAQANEPSIVSKVEKPVATLNDLNEDCMLLVLSYVAGPRLCSLSRVSRQFYWMVNNSALWHHSIVSGPVSFATQYVEKALVPRAKKIVSLTFIDLHAHPLLNTDFQFHLTSTFFASLDTLFQKCGPHLHTLRIQDGDDSFMFSLSHVLFASIAQYAKELKRVVLAGTEETLYVEDSNVLLLTMACAGVEEFVDGQSWGVTPEALHYMIDGWKCLHTLHLNTELQPIHSFSLTISQFGPRLRSLSLTHFHDSLNSHTIPILAHGLSRLSKLEKLTLDLSLTNHCDGLREEAWREVFGKCGRVRSVEYVVGFDAYFEEVEDRYG